MHWDNASRTVAGATEDGPAIKVIKKLVAPFREWPSWALEEERLQAAQDSIEDPAPHLGRVIELPVAVVHTDALGVELRSTEKVRLRREEMSWLAGLKNEAGIAPVWRIVPPTVEEFKKTPDAYGPVNIYAMLVSDAHFATQKLGVERSISQAKQIAYAIKSFEQDMGGKFPFGKEEWEEDLFPYLTSQGLLTAPGDEQDAVSYSLNFRLAGKVLEELKEPEKTVLLYLGKNEKLDFRYDGQATVAFADGSVRTVRAGEALRWGP